MLLIIKCKYKQGIVNTSSLLQVNMKPNFAKDPKYS